MKETIELSPSILDYLNQEPEERKYWRAGYTLRDSVPCNDEMDCYITESAAWRGRESVARDDDYFFTLPAPVQATRQEVTEIARNFGCHTVNVLDEHHQVVEQWTV